MEPEDAKKLVKRVAVAGSFFLLGLIFYWLRWPRALTVYAILCSILLVLAVLIQSGRGGGLAAMGGLDTDALLGTRSATPIAKATYVMGALFIFLCMLVARLGVVQARDVEKQQESAVREVPLELPGVSGGTAPIADSPLPPAATEDTETEAESRQ